MPRRTRRPGRAGRPGAAAVARRAGLPEGRREHLPAWVRHEVDRAAAEVEPGGGDRTQADDAAQGGDRLRVGHPDGDREDVVDQRVRLRAGGDVVPEPGAPVRDAVQLEQDADVGRVQLHDRVPEHLLVGRQSHPRPRGPAACTRARRAPGPTGSSRPGRPPGQPAVEVGAGAERADHLEVLLLADRHVPVGQADRGQLRIPESGRQRSSPASRALSARASPVARTRCRRTAQFGSAGMVTSGFRRRNRTDTTVIGAIWPEA